MASAVVPGSAQLWLGRRRRGRLMLGVTLAVAAVVAPLAALGGSDPVMVLGLLVHTDVLAAALGVNVALCAFRLLCALDAYRLARGRVPRPNVPPHLRTAAAPLARVTAAALVAGLVLAPHAAVGFYNLRAFEAVSRVFGAEGHASGWADHAGRALISSVRPTERVSVLLLGGDAGPERAGLRTDSMIVASLDPRTGQVSMFGLPRALKQVPLPDDVAADVAGELGCWCFPGVLNELYIFGEENPELFGGEDPGALAVKGAAEELLGIPIDHYVLVDMAGFVEVVDALGGVDVEVTRAVTDRLSPPIEGTEARTYDLEPGSRHLDGHEALAYARSRTDTDDFDRMERQRCILTALAGQADPARLLASLPQLLSAAERNVRTDVPLDELPALLAAGERADLDPVVSLSLSPDHHLRFDEEGYPVADVAAVRETVRLALEHPEAFTTDPAAATQPAGPCG